MTTTTDTLTRWLPLWEQDEGLRPQSLHWDGPGEDDHGGIYPASWMLRNRQTKPYVAAALIRDSAVRWLAEKGLQPTIDNSHPLGNPWAVVLADEMSCGLDAPCGGETLDDALYAACKAVLGEEKT